VLTKGKLPASVWIEVISTAHELGLPTSATMMYGHVDTPKHWVGHLRTIRSVQERTGGFTEFVLLPFIHENAPIYLAGLARPGPTRRENRAVHAVSRLLLAGAIDSIQCSWVKLGDEGCRDVLAGGVNDLGGTLMEETISRMAGADHGSYKTISGLKSHPAADHHLRRGLRRAPGRRGRHRRRVCLGALRPAAARYVSAVHSLAGKGISLTSARQ
jgi:FO synthase